MRDIIALIQRVGHSRASVLITGESGTGKEVIARTLHFHGSRSEKPFVPINCTAIPEGLLESELFGHVRGAFTGAHTNKRGLFEKANGGTLFLDEVGDMGLALQGKLLRVLQDREIRPVGGTHTVKVDVRIIAATNKDLPAEIAAGRFREDLFYRLNVVPIHVPPLRERPDDIPALVSRFLDEEPAAAGRRIEPEAMRQLREWPWPGNVRELRHAVQRTLVQSEGDVITGFDLAFDDVGGNGEDTSLDARLLEEALLRHGGRLAPVAAELGVSVRTVQRRIKDCGLRLADFRRNGGRLD
jgi:transcriptional regulator with GAF, ATPase, and Fis domain